MPDILVPILQSISFILIVVAAILYLSRKNTHDELDERDTKADLKAYSKKPSKAPKK